MAINQELEFKELFLSEALEEYDDISQNLVKLEAAPDEKHLVQEIFRLLHNLKANSRATGYEAISHLAHVLETIFSAVRDELLPFKGKLITLLFDGVDLLGEWLRNIDNSDFIPPKLLIANLEAAAAEPNIDAIEALDIQKEISNTDLSLSDLVYIPVRHLDNLMNLVGELIIDRDRVQAVANQHDHPQLRAIASHLHRVTSALQMSVMDARLVSIGSLFNKFPRIVRDVAQSEGKQVRLIITGQEIKIDRNILQLISDSLLHLVRNAINHGLGTPEERATRGKGPEGTLRLDASTVRDLVVIRVSDDGKGINTEQIRQAAIKKNWVPAEKAKAMTKEELNSLLFEPGFSLSSSISEISGRGVGLDVVKTSLDTIGGRLTLESELDKGTSFVMSLPTSIAVKGSLLLVVDETVYAIPLVHIDAVVTLPVEQLHTVGTERFVADIRRETVQVAFLSDLFNQRRSSNAATDGHYEVVVVMYANRKVGLVVDRLMRQQDIVVKPLQKPIDGIELFGGVTLLGHGEVCFVLDVPAIFRLMGKGAKSEPTLN